MSEQPVWKLLWASDCEALFVDETGTYDPELAIAQEIDDAPKTERFQVYRFACEGLRAYRESDGRIVLCFRNYKSDWCKPASAYLEWYQEHLPEVARSCGRSTLSLVRDLVSDDPNALASAYRDIGGHFGYDNFDSEPATWSEYEMQDWPERKNPEADPAAYADWLTDDGRDEFIAGYIECSMWANLMMYKCEHRCNAYECDECDPHTIAPELESADADPGEYVDELTDAAREIVERDCNDFFTANAADLVASGLDMEQCGHDFALTRNRHGAGFWDRKSRGKKADAALDRLTEASHAYGSQDFIVNADGKVDVL